MWSFTESDAVADDTIGRCASSPCPACNHSSFLIRVQRRYSYLFFIIPFAVNSTTKYIECEHCGLRLSGYEIPKSTLDYISREQFKVPFRLRYYTWVLFFVLTIIGSITLFGPEIFLRTKAIVQPHEGDIYIIRWRKFLKESSYHFYDNVPSRNSANDFAIMRLDNANLLDRDFRLILVLYESEAQACRDGFAASKIKELEGPKLHVDVSALLGAYSDHGLARIIRSKTQSCE